MAGARTSSDETDENTPILSNGGLNGGLTRRASTMKFLFNRKQTPGTEHDKWYYRWPALIWHTTKVTLMSSYVNVLIVFVPLGIAAGELHWNPTTVFILNFFAIVPLAAILAFGTEEISIKLGQTLGGLMNASFGNVVELIVSIIENVRMRLLISTFQVSIVALRQGEISIVQASMLGSILSNLLLVLGCAFIAGGIHNTRTGTSTGIEQNFNGTVASTMSSLLAVSSASLIIPATVCSTWHNPVWVYANLWIALCSPH